MLEFNMIDEMENRYGETLEERLHPDVAAALRENYMRAILLNTPPRRNAKNVMANSWFYGQPTLPEDIPWPVYNRKGIDIPMSFVLQLDCSDVPRLEEYPFPEKGVLLFFYEFNFQLERCLNDTMHLSAKVIYLDDITGISQRKMPRMPDLDTFPQDDLEDDPYWHEGHLAYGYIKPAQIEPVLFGKFDDFMNSSFFREDRNIRMIYSNASNNALVNQYEIMKKNLGISKKQKWGRHHVFGVRESYGIDQNKNYMTLLSLSNNDELKFRNSIFNYYIKHSDIEEINFNNIVMLEGP